MKRCAVIVGVDQTGGLPKLKAAASGARDFERWATSQGIDSHVLTDEIGPVRFEDVKSAVTSFLDTETYHQILLFFAGHGMLKAADAEVWLLSEAPKDQDEAVNLPLTVSYARNAPVKHVVFISDACRSLPTDPRQSGVMGRSAFPNYQPPQRRPRVDLLFAAAPGDPAWEAPLDEALKCYRGIYSSVLLDGLKGTDPTVPEPYEGRCYVFTRRLDGYLAREVPKAASRVNLTLRQLPETRPESGPPLFLSEVRCPPESVSIADSGTPSPPRARSLGEQSYRGTEEQRRDQPTDPAEDRVQSSMNLVLAAQGRESFETRIGFSVRGTRVVEAYTPDRRSDLFEEDHATHVRLEVDQPTSALLVFEDGSATMLAAWPGYIGTVLVEDGRVMNVNYTPARGTPEYDLFEHQAVEVAQRRALIASKALHGRFQLDPEKADEDAFYLRQFKRIDPTLGIYAAYAYAQAGAVEPIRSVLRYMQEDLQGGVPFDVALLAGVIKEPYLHTDFDRRMARPATGLVPLAPMLTQGWMLLGDAFEHLWPRVRHAGRYLRPALWTTFTPEGARLLTPMFHK